LILLAAYCWDLFFLLDSSAVISFSYSPISATSSNFDSPFFSFVFYFFFFSSVKSIISAISSSSFCIFVSSFFEKDNVFI